MKSHRFIFIACLYVLALPCIVNALTDGTKKWGFPTGGMIHSSPAIGTDGTVYVGSGDGKLYAINTDSAGLANSAWPMFHKDNRHTGNTNTSNTCRADCNADGKVNTTDLGIMKTEFFRTNCATVPCQADINNDNKVNTTDLGIMKTEFFRTNCFQY